MICGDLDSPAYCNCTTLSRVATTTDLQSCRNKIHSRCLLRNRLFVIKHAVKYLWSYFSFNALQPLYDTTSVRYDLCTILPLYDTTSVRYDLCTIRPFYYGHLKNKCLWFNEWQVDGKHFQFAESYVLQCTDDKNPILSKNESLSRTPDCDVSSLWWRYAPCINIP